MPQAKLLAIALAGVLALYAVVGATAAPGILPGSGDDGPAIEDVEDGDETPEATETGEADETPEAIETEEADDDGDEAEDEGVDEGNGLGVPADSPACTTENHDPNPHDTDDDGDGCREVETEDGTKNLPDPAADAHEGHPGDIEDADEDAGDHEGADDDDDQDEDDEDGDDEDDD